MGWKNRREAGVRQGGVGTYDAAEIAKRRKRASIMARNNTPGTEAMNEDSTAVVLAILASRELFP